MNRPQLSIVIATYNDNAELEKTISSIVLTAPEGAYEIVVVDDCSAPRPIAIDRWHCVQYVRNSRRVGCGPSRYIGAVKARGEWLLFVDSHTRFFPGWFETWQGRCGMSVKAIYCGACIPFSDSKPNGSPHFGATWNFCGPDRQKPRLNQVFECVWAPEQPEDVYEIPALMGACYICHRDWFIHLNALSHLRLWGGDEQELSLKAWLAGGSILMLKPLQIAHKFREGKVTSSFVMPHHIHYNKLLVMHTCLPPLMANRLQAKMQRDPQFGIALRTLHENWNLVETMRAFNGMIFQSTFEWYLDRFKLPFPQA